MAHFQVPTNVSGLSCDPGGVSDYRMCPTNHGTFEAKDPDVDCENPIARDACRWRSAVSFQALALRCVKCLRRPFAEPHAPGLKALKWRDG